MKKYLTATTILLLLFIFIAYHTQAGGLEDAFGNNTLNRVATTSGYAVGNNGPTTSIEGMVGLVLKLLISLLGAIFIVTTFIAANMWMRASGNEEKVKKAKKILSQSLIGLSLVIIAYTLSNFLIKIFADLLIK